MKEKRVNKWTLEYKREYHRKWMRNKRANQRKMYIYKLRHPNCIISKEEVELFTSEDHIYINQVNEKEKTPTRNV